MSDPTMILLPPEETTPRRRSKPGRLTARDVDMLESLSTARYLTVEALEWLHVPGWQARWERHQARGKGRYYPSTYLYERLHFLLSEGWVYRLKRAIQVGGERFGMESDLYGVTEEGARLLALVRRCPLEEIHYDRKRTRSYFTVSHGVEIGTFYAALKTRMALKAELSMEDWRGEHLTAKAYDRVLVRRQAAKGGAEIVPLPVQPDATFVWHYPGGAERIFVEIDRGTRSLATWVEKIQAYTAYMGSDELQARYGTRTFMLLTVAPTEDHCQKLMRATASVLGKPNGRYLFCCRSAVHPLRIGVEWTKLAQVTPVAKGWPVVEVGLHSLIR